jgi:hypothetical protein
MKRDLVDPQLPSRLFNMIANSIKIVPLYRLFTINPISVRAQTRIAKNTNEKKII